MLCYYKIGNFLLAKVAEMHQSQEKCIILLQFSYLMAVAIHFKDIKRIEISFGERTLLDICLSIEKTPIISRSTLQFKIEQDTCSGVQSACKNQNHYLKGVTFPRVEREAESASAQN